MYNPKCWIRFKILSFFKTLPNPPCHLQELLHMANLQYMCMTDTMISATSRRLYAEQKLSCDTAFCSPGVDAKPSLCRCYSSRGSVTSGIKALRASSLSCGRKSSAIYHKLLGNHVAETRSMLSMRTFQHQMRPRSTQSSYV